MSTIRIACKVFYLGDNYRGFQFQSDVPTIEGKIKEALLKSNLIKDEISSNFQGASRTDALVHALGNAFAFDTNERIILPQINHYLPNDITVWAKKEVKNDFSPRFDAIKRHYKYITKYEGENLKEMELEAKKFVGKHDFVNYSKKGEYKSTIREIHEVKVQKIDEFLIFDFIGASFLYQMVRRMVKILLEIGKGNIANMVDFYFTNQLDATKRVHPAPLNDEGALILCDVIYPFEFEVDDYSFKKMQKLIQNRFQIHSIRLETMKIFQNLFKKMK